MCGAISLFALDTEKQILKIDFMWLYFNFEILSESNNQTT